MLQPVAKLELHLVGVTASFIAAKYEDVEAPDAVRMLKFAKDQVCYSGCCIHWSVFGVEVTRAGKAIAIAIDLWPCMCNVHSP